jgi:L-ascorbate metabolism protein UlaG (beta-lactamase superfamily)
MRFRADLVRACSFRPAYRRTQDPGRSLFFSDNPPAAPQRRMWKPITFWMSHGHSDHVGDTVAIARRTGPRSYPTPKSVSG